MDSNVVSLAILQGTMKCLKIERFILSIQKIIFEKVISQKKLAYIFLNVFVNIESVVFKVLGLGLLIAIA